MIFDTQTHLKANNKAIALNNMLNPEQAALLVHIPAAESTAKKPFYRADTCCVPVDDASLLPWPTTSAEMSNFTYKCAAAKLAYSRWILWAVSNKDKTLSESTAQYSVFLLEELTPYI